MPSLSSNKSMVKVTVYSDLAWPWCYVGQQRLQKAISQFGQNRVEVVWKPFMIDPGTDPKGEDMEAYCRRRWGSSGWTRSMISQGKKDGARFDNWKWWPHTLKAHQLVHYCAVKHNICSSGKVNQVLFQFEYERGENISNVATLVAIGRELGIQEETTIEDLKQYLSNDMGKKEVKEEIAIGGQRYGISGVPFFIVGRNQNNNGPRPQVLSGAQNSETFLQLFQELCE